MKNILDKIYCILEPAVTIKGGSSDIIDRAERKFCKKLKGKEKKLFNDYELAYSQFNAITATESFKQGFKVGFDFAKEMEEL